MKEHPILFSTPMVQAILEGRKSQTRRIMKIQPESVDLQTHTTIPYNGSSEFLLENCKSRYGQIGDILWVRETWQTWALGWIFKATYGDNLPEGIKWKPSIFMPKEACRIRLEITNIRVERLCDITEEDSMAEGIDLPNYAE